MSILRFSFFVLLLMFATSSLHSQWVIAWGNNAERLISSDTNLYAIRYQHLYQLTDKGNGFTDMGFSNTSITAFAVSGKNIFAATVADGGIYNLYHSTDNGKNWIEVKNNFPDCMVTNLIVSGQHIFASTSGYGIFHSTDNGSNWNEVNVGLNDHDIITLAISDTILYAVSYSSNLFASTNYGSNWTEVNHNLPNTYISLLEASRESIFVLSETMIYVSKNKGVYWKPVNKGLEGLYVNCLAFFESNVFIGTNRGAFYSTNNGTRWNSIDSNGMIDNNIFALAIHGADLYAGSSTNVWRRPLSEIITPSTVLPNEQTTKLMLEQNHPNPFINNTQITYSLPKTTYVTVKVYDMLGREVSVLVDGIKTVGLYDINLDASELPEGRYFYTLRTGELSTTKMLVLQKNK